MAYSEFTEKDYELIRKDFELLEASARKRCAGEEELDLVRRAFNFANEAHKNVRRRSGEPYMLHPIAVARIVVDDIGLGCKSIAAALLHDVVEDTDYTIDDIRSLFGDKIAQIVEGLTKIKNVLDTGDKTLTDQASLQAENFKRILLTLNDDVRVVLVKLADRLHNCRTIQHMPEHKRDKILSETMFIFIPLAHQLGLYGIKSELENIWLRYKEPSAYREIEAKIAASVREKGKDMDAFVAPIEETLRKAGFRFEIKRRIKTPYSVWRKMKVKQISFDEVYDLYAIRIIFEADTAFGETERDQCYQVYTRVSSLYRDKEGRLRDWVRNAKPNGYEALHCTLLSPGGAWVEVQIRTRRMDDIAEKGIAAHWAYKKDGYSSERNSEIEVWLSQIKEILANPDVSSLELLDIIHNDLTSAEIYVFTPKGEQRTIPKGATVLDFAYRIHSEVGNRAIAAKVNMRLAPLNRVLHSGDQVEIITAEQAQPKREWLQFLQTRRAKNIVLDYFREERKKNIELGKKALGEKLAALGYSEDGGGEVMRRLLFHYQLTTAEELYVGIGIGTVKLDELSDVLGKKQQSAPSKSRSWFPWRSSQKGDANPAPKDKGGEMPLGARYVIATCCNPIPGDAVVGFKGPDGTVTVHKKTCPIAGNLASKYGNLLVVPDWDGIGGRDAFPVRIQIKGVDRIGMLSDIARLITQEMNVNMRKLYLAAEDGLFDGYIEVLVHEKSEIDTMLTSLKGVAGVDSVIRKEL